MFQFLDATFLSLWTTVLYFAWRLNIEATQLLFFDSPHINKCGNLSSFFWPSEVKSLDVARKHRNQTSSWNPLASGIDNETYLYARGLCPTCLGDMHIVRWCYYNTCLLACSASGRQRLCCEAPHKRNLDVKWSKIGCLADLFERYSLPSEITLFCDARNAPSFLSKENPL